jgi:very-short-patch-repair endonuclease
MPEHLPEHSRARYITAGQAVEASKLQRAKELRRTMTAAERRLWQALRANRFRGLHFRRQQVIDGFIVDFYCHTLGLVIEVDGDVHAEQADYDAERDRTLAARGLQVLRIRNIDVLRKMPAVLEQIAAWVDRGAT